MIFNFVPLQALWWRGVRRNRLGAVPDLLSVAIGMWLERYMILVTSLYRDYLVSSWGNYHADVLGLADLFRHVRPVPGAVPPVIRLLPVISIFETKEVLHEEQEEATAMAERLRPAGRIRIPEALVAAAAARGGRLSPDRRLHAVPVEGLAEVLRLQRPRVAGSD